MNEFFVLEPDKGTLFGTTWAYADIIEPSNNGEYDRCPVCHRAVSPLRWLPPHRVKLSSAKPEKCGDFVWGAGFPLLVSSRFREIYETEELTGIGEFSEPVEIVRMGTRKTGDFPVTPPNYYLVYVPWGGANQDDRASCLTHENPQEIKCPYCRVGVSWRKQDRIVIENGSWNGSDIFKARNTPTRFLVSERFKRVAEKYHFTNIWLIPSTNFGYDERRPGLWYVNE
jgi:hypothetical protein